MTSLLPVCLALLLPACVLGQTLYYEPALSIMCTTPEQIGKITACSNEYLYALSVTSGSALNTVCKNTDVFVEHNRCLRAVWLTCVPKETQGLIPTDDIVRDSLLYLCHNMDADDYECATYKADYCAKLEYRNFVADLDKPGLVDRTCRAMDSVGQCVHDRCTAENRSMEVYDQYWRKAYAPACSSSSCSSFSSFCSSVSLAFAACAVLLAKMAARIL